MSVRQLRVVVTADDYDEAVTFYRDIRRLPSAHRLIADRDGVRLERYWSLDPTHELRFASDDEYAAGFVEHFTEAVRSRLRSAYPVGSMLSGGLDSSSIVSAARRVHPGVGILHTFSAIFPDLPECDERPFIDAVVALNKELLLRQVPVPAGSQYVFTRLELKEPPPHECRLDLEFWRTVGGLHFITRIIVDDVRFGMVHFSRWNRS